MAKLYFYYSTMNAGKSTLLLQAAYNYRERGMHAVILLAELDDRGGKGVVSSRIGLKAEAVKAEASNPANAPQNTSDVAPGNDAASTELQPDATPAPEAEWSGRHTAILLIAITLSLFAGYALAFLYRLLADGKKARMMDEAPASPPGGAPRTEAAAEPSRA